jgi:glycosyltransferase involved in cell wall biosynthesis
MYPSPESPGFGVFVKNFATDAECRGVEIEYAVMRKPGLGLRKVFDYMRFFLRVWHCILFKRYDLIYVHYMTHSLLPLIPLRRMLKKPLVINVHGTDLLGTSRFTKWAHRLVKPLVEKAAFIVVPSVFFRDVFQQKFKQDRMLVSPSAGVNRDLFKPEKQPEDYFSFCLVSRIEDAKGWQIFVEAVRLFRETEPDAKFRAVVVGGGSKLTELRERVGQLGLAGDIAILGEKAHQDLKQVFNSSDLSVFPTLLEESLGLVGLEAMACGVPVAASAIGAIPEYVIPGETGYLFSAGCAESLAKILIDHYHNRQQISAELTDNCLKMAAKYDANVVGLQLWAQLAKLVKEESA